MKLYRPLPGVTISLKDEGELQLMREAGRIVALAQAADERSVVPAFPPSSGLYKSGEQLSVTGAVPAFIGQEKPNSPRYTHATTASINHEVVHGIPRADRILHDGDIISLDTGTIYKGFVGDGAWTYAVGEIKPSVQRLLEMTEKSLYLGLTGPPRRVREVVATASKLSKQAGYALRDYNVMASARNVGRTADPKLCKRTKTRRSRARH